MDLIDLIEEVDVSLENMDWDQFSDDDMDVISYSERKDHPMSGYGGSFEACDFDITITRKSDSEFEVKVDTERFGGSLPGYYQRQLDSGEMDWEEVFEDYDDLRSGKGETGSYSETFETFESALEYADGEIEFEG